MISKLRSKFPNTVTLETIKQLGIAPNNESAVINALQFINLIDSDGQKNTENAQALLLNDEEFQDAFAKIIHAAYRNLFEVHGEDAWSQDVVRLTTFFRQTDQTSEVIGRRQARVFQMFASLGGKIEEPNVRKRLNKSGKKTTTSSKKEPQQARAKVKPASTMTGGRSFDSLGMSIKIDVNLPSDASKETYDNIFKSIREHLIDG